MESIYNFVCEPKKVIPKTKMYRSKYDPKAPLTGSTFGLRGTTVTVGKGINDLKKTCVVSSTFGPRPGKEQAHGPSNFLRKGSRQVSKISESSPTSVCDNGRSCRAKNKPPVPFRDDKPVLGLKTHNNFVTENAVNVILSSAKPEGNKDLNFMKKDDYGKVPEYLHEIKDEIKREHDMIDLHVKQQLDENRDPVPEYDIMDEAERQKLVGMLQKKWDDVNRNYQKICHRVTMETFGDIRRKEAQEAELQELENDIAKLSKPGPIMIQINSIKH